MLNTIPLKSQEDCILLYLIIFALSNIGVQDTNLTFFSSSNLAPKFFKVVVQSKKLWNFLFQRQKGYLKKNTLFNNSSFHQGIFLLLLFLVPKVLRSSGNSDIAILSVGKYIFLITVYVAAFFKFKNHSIKKPTESMWKVSEKYGMMWARNMHC